jgi:DNA polymerase-3 subunit beta
MKVTLEASALAAIMTRAAGVVPTRTNIDILRHVRLEASEGGTLTITATNMDSILNHSIDAVVDDPADICLPAVQLRDIAAHAPDGAQVEITLEDSVARVRVGRSRFKLPTRSADEFTLFKPPAWDAHFSMPAAELTRMFTVVRHAMSDQETRYYLCGIYLAVKDGDILTAATTGHVLSECCRTAPEGCEGDVMEKGIIIPRAAVAHILSLIDETDRPLDFHVSSEVLAVDIGRTGYMTRLIDGEFPDHRRIIPESSDKMITVGRAALRDAISRASVAFLSIAKTALRDVLLEATEGGSLTVTAGVGDNEAVDEIDADISDDAKDLRLGAQAHYLDAALAAIESDRVMLSVQDAGAPILIEGDADACHVVMPIRIPAKQSKPVEEAAA